MLYVTFCFSMLIDAVIDVSLASGIEASIIIDGTEHCPGKQGINLVSLDFINYKYSKGKVIQPSELQAFVSTHFESMKESDPVFVATQGDCIISTTGNISLRLYKVCEAGR